MAAPKKRIRARRARARQRERQGVDLRGRYRAGDLPVRGHIGVVELDDPFAPAGWIDADAALDPQARLKQPRRADGSVAAGEPEWIAPPRQRVCAVRSLRGDVIGRMHQRHQVGDAQYHAARTYQDLHEVANLGPLASAADLVRPGVDGGRVSDPITDAKLAATRRLRSVEGTLKDWHGETGLGLVRAVLIECTSVERAAIDFGARSALERRSVGWLFRRCLDVLARSLGLSNTARRPRPVRLHGDGAPDLADPALNAAASELIDPVLRRGRPNGAAP